jgi:hypothetical protein
VKSLDDGRQTMTKAQMVFQPDELNTHQNQIKNKLNKHILFAL